MSDPQHEDDTTGEVDPTGVRALLSSLPDPGPMPEDLVARITSSLQAEQQRREFQGEHAEDTPHLIDLTTERHRRRPGRSLAWLASAAAVAVAATVAISQWSGDGPGVGDAASVIPQPSGSSSGQSSPEPPTDAADAGEAPAATEAEAPPAPATETHSEDDPEMAATGMGRSGPDLVTGGSAPLQLSDDATAQAELLSAWIAADIDLTAPIHPVDGAYDRCLEALDPIPGNGETVAVSSAVLAGDDVVVVALLDAEPQTAWVLSASCTAGRGEIVSGPLELPATG